MMKIKLDYVIEALEFVNDDIDCIAYYNPKNKRNILCWRLHRRSR